MKIAIIPARGGSQRIKSKNVVDFFGKPIIFFALDAAKKAGLFDKIHVSTESEEIRSIVEDLGYSTDFLRPHELADDLTGIVPVLQWVLKQYVEKGIVYDDVCCIMPTAPLLEPEDLKIGYEVYKKHQKKFTLLTVAKLPVPVDWAFFRDEETFLTSITPNALLIRSQDLKTAYYEAGPFSFFNASQLLGDNLPRNMVSYLLPQNRAVDIDDAEDLELAKTLYLGRLAQKKQNKGIENETDFHDMNRSQ